MFRFFLSMRYMRARRTNWIGVAGIFVAVGALILILSIMTGFLDQSRIYLRGDLSDVVITPLFGRDIEPGVRPDRDPAQALEILRADEAVSGASAQLLWYGMLVPPRGESVITDPLARSLVLVSFVGVDIPDEFSVTDLGQNLRREARNGTAMPPTDPDDPFALPLRYSPDGRPADPVILGVQLASTWKLRIGDEIELATGTMDPDTGAFQEAVNRRVVVVGTFTSEHNEQDLQRIYMKRENLASWLGRTDSYSQIAVKLHDYERDHQSFRARMGNELYTAGYLHAPGAFSWQISTWEDARKGMLAAIENERALLGVMLGLVLLVAAFTIFAILSMLVSEKRRDIGILCALGATPSGILSLFLMIGAWEALLGSLLGGIAGTWAAANINAIEGKLTDWTGVQIFNREVYLFDHIPTVTDPAAVAAIVLGAVCMTLIAAALPAIRAARLNPVDALRYE